MSWFKLKGPIGTNYRVDPGVLMDTKRALNQLGYYAIPPHRGIDDWTDDATFDGIRRFQRDNGLKVDALIRPDGPTETAINQRLSERPAPINAGPLLNQFNRTMSPEFYAGGLNGYAESYGCCATGTMDCERDVSV